MIISTSRLHPVNIVITHESVSFFICSPPFWHSDRSNTGYAQTSPCHLHLHRRCPFHSSLSQHISHISSILIPQHAAENCLRNTWVFGRTERRSRRRTLRTRTSRKTQMFVEYSLELFVVVVGGKMVGLGGSDWTFYVLRQLSGKRSCRQRVALVRQLRLRLRLKMYSIESGMRIQVSLKEEVVNRKSDATVKGVSDYSQGSEKRRDGL